MITLALGFVAGCSDDGSRAAVRGAVRSVVTVDSQRCERPNRTHGLGLLVGDGLVLTAGHTVEGDLRDLTVDGQPAEVVLIDRNSDLAIVAAPLSPPRERTDTPSLSALRPENLVLIGPDGPRDVHVDSRETLVIEHVSDRATYRREVVVFTPGVAEGSSGTPLVDAQGRLAGVVILDDETNGQGIAADVTEIATLLDAATDTASESRPASPGSC